MKTLEITGPLSDDDIAAFTELLRRIDDANPTGLYRLTVVDPEGRSAEDAEPLLTIVLPPDPGRVTARFVHSMYIDDGYPARDCDRCGRTYRGPAVYCSFDCAVADA